MPILFCKMKGKGPMLLLQDLTPTCKREDKGELQAKIGEDMITH